MPGLHHLSLEEVFQDLININRSADRAYSMGRCETIGSPEESVAILLHDSPRTLSLARDPGLSDLEMQLHGASLEFHPVDPLEVKLEERFFHKSSSGMSPKMSLDRPIGQIYFGVMVQSSLSNILLGGDCKLDEIWMFLSNIGILNGLLRHRS